VVFSRLKAHRRILLVVALPLMLVFPTIAAAAVQWTSGETIPAAGSNSQQPHVAALPSGQAIAVWSRNNGTNDVVEAAVRNASGAWGAAQTLSSPGQSAFEPRIATDPNGNAVAVWTRSDGANLRIESAYRPAGGSFGSVQIISPAGAGASQPRVSMDAQGNAVAIWARQDPSVAKERIQVATRPAGTGSSFGTAETLSTSSKNAFQPVVAAEPNGNAVAAWTATNSILEVQSSSKLDVPGYPRPAAAAQLRVSLAIAYRQCTTGAANRQHGPALIAQSCNPHQQESNVLTVGVFDANGFAAQNSGFVKLTVCPSGTTGTGVCSTPVGMTAPDVRVETNTTDVRCRATNAACPGGFGSDYEGKLLLKLPLRITDRFNGSIGTDPATVSDLDFNIPMQCTFTGSNTIGGTCGILTRINAVMAGAIASAKRGNWELKQIEVKDAGPNGTGYDACPPTCGDGDEAVFARQGIFVP
jgi:hypothetical protein